MKKLTSTLFFVGSFFAMISIQNSQAQCLVTTGPTNDCSYGDAIDEITIDVTTVANSGCSNGSGYSSFAAPIWNFTLGASYAMTASLGGGSYDQALAIWIDLDNNGQFDASEQVYASTTADLIQTGIVAIPAIGVSGVALPMRVMCAYAQPTIAAADACVSNQGGYGETEDYTVILAPSSSSNVAATSVFEPFDNDCGDINDEVWVSVTNLTANAEDTVPVQLNLSGMFTGTYYDTIQLAANQEDSVLMATINTEAGGILNAELIVNLGDDDATDDTLTVSIAIQNSTDLSISGGTSVCANDSVDIMVDNVVAGETYTWFLDGTMMTTGDVFNTGALTTSSQVVAISDNACRMNDTLDITLIPNATATFTNSVVDFDADFVGTATDYDSVYWDFGDGSTGSGLTTQHTYAQNGVYYVCFNAVSQCGTVSFCDSVTVASTMGLQEFAGGTVSVYPNPTTDKVSLDFSSTKGISGEWKLYNMDGRELQSGNVKNNSHQSIEISLGEFASGTYLFKLIDENGETYQQDLIRQ